MSGGGWCQGENGFRVKDGVRWEDGFGGKDGVRGSIVSGAGQCEVLEGRMVSEGGGRIMSGEDGVRGEDGFRKRMVSGRIAPRRRMVSVREEDGVRRVDVVRGRMVCGDGVRGEDGVREEDWVWGWMVSYKPPFRQKGRGVTKVLMNKYNFHS